jgi:hypothetical protein
VVVPPDAEAVLVTGVYGAGKSTAVAEVGAVLAGHGQHYGLLDVDWLGWFDAGGDSRSHQRVVLANVTSVCTSFLDEGVRRLVLAWSIRDREHLGAIRQAVPVPLRVVRLEVSVQLVEQRLSSDPTQERRTDDLRVAREWLAAGRGTGLEDLLLPGDQPVRETARAICSWLGWV